MPTLVNLAKPHFHVVYNISLHMHQAWPINMHRSIYLILAFPSRNSSRIPKEWRLVAHSPQLFLRISRVDLLQRDCSSLGIDQAQRGDGSETAIFSKGRLFS